MERVTRGAKAKYTIHCVADGDLTLTNFVCLRFTINALGIFANLGTSVVDQNSLQGRSKTDKRDAFWKVLYLWKWYLAPGEGGAIYLYKGHFLLEEKVLTWRNSVLLAFQIH